MGFFFIVNMPKLLLPRNKSLQSDSFRVSTTKYLKCSASVSSMLTKVCSDCSLEQHFSIYNCCSQKKRYIIIIAIFESLIRKFLFQLLSYNFKRSKRSIYISSSLALTFLLSGSSFVALYSASSLF